MCSKVPQRQLYANMNRRYGHKLFIFGNLEFLRLCTFGAVGFAKDSISQLAVSKSADRILRVRVSMSRCMYSCHLGVSAFYSAFRRLRITVDDQSEFLDKLRCRMVSVLWKRKSYFSCANKLIVVVGCFIRRAF